MNHLQHPFSVERVMLVWICRVLLGLALPPCLFWTNSEGFRGSGVHQGENKWCRARLLAQRVGHAGCTHHRVSYSAREKDQAKHLLLLRGVGCCHSKQWFKTSGKGFTWPPLAWGIESSPVRSLRECRSKENTSENSIPLFLSVLHSSDRGKFHYTLMDS